MYSQFWFMTLMYFGVIRPILSEYYNLVTYLHFFLLSGVKIVRNPTFLVFRINSIFDNHVFCLYSCCFFCLFNILELDSLSCLVFQGPY